MAAPTYTTDLTLINNGETGTWVEMTGWAVGGAPQVNTTEWYIQGTGCVTQAMNNKTALESAAFDNVSDLSGSFSAGDCFFMWHTCLAGVALATFANGGIRAIIGSGLGDFKAWKGGGSDYAPNPYGGWKNVAYDPTFTADYTVGSPGTAYRYFGSGILPVGGVQKGEMHCIDALRYGRGDLIIQFGDLSNGYATFIGAAAQNDSINNRWGLLQAIAGGYLWKGLISLGTTTNAVDMRTSNVNINVDDTPRTYVAFNRIEVVNVSSRVDWTNVKIVSLDPSGLSIGQFEMIANADINWSGCGFTGLSTFIFLSNATVLNTTWQSCSLVTGAGGVFTGSKVLESTVAADASAFNWNVATDPNGKLDDMTFSKGTNAHHAVEFGLLSPLTMTVKGWTTTGFNASNGQNDSTFHIKRTSGTVTINVVGGTGNFSYKSAGAIVVIVINPVTLEVTVIDSITKTAIQGASVFVKAADGTGPLPFEETVTISRVGDVATVSHTAHGLSTGHKVEIEGAVQNEYNRIKTITVTGVNAYTYPVYGSPATPATGTIKSTGVLISGDSDASGQISDSRTFGSNQSYTGSVKKGSSAPVYVGASLTGTVDKDNGKEVTVPMISD